jgi:myosin V
MSFLGLARQQQLDIFKTILSVLHISNVSFSDGDGRGGDGSAVVGASSTLAAQLLGCSQDALHQALTHREIKVSTRETYSVPQDKEAAARTRDTVAQTLYLRLFAYIVEAVNATLLSDPPPSSPRVCAVLDMFGFESFETNRFEQLCINYANERLQQHFNAHNFEREREEYMNEGIPLDATEFAGTGSLLALLDGKQGLWSALEEEALLPNGSDDNFHSKLDKLDKGKGGDISTKGKRLTMTLKHYAGSVTYSLEGVLLANRLQAPSLSTALLSSSSLPFISQVPAPPLHTRPLFHPLSPSS